MRERTTWDRTRIASDLRKVADDPRAMNQDHHSQQPAADAYVIGGPSEFAEDVAKPNWKVELDSNGNTKRNEIGMPEMRADSLKNASEDDDDDGQDKEAADDQDDEGQDKEATHGQGDQDDQDDDGQDKEAAIQAKAVLATKAARAMLPRTASEDAIENQAFSLMALDESNLKSTISRLATDDQDDDGQDKEAADDQDDEGQDKEAADDQDDEGQDKEAKGQVPEAFKENIQKMKDKAKDKGDKPEDDDAKSQDKEASDDEDEGQDKEASAAKLAELKQQILACNDMSAMQDLMSQQQMVQQQQLGQQDDGELVDQLLMEQQGQQIMSESDIQMDSPQMDTGNVQLTAADDVLNQVFASSVEVQNALEAAAYQGNPVTAGTARTASTRTVGTRPASGVSTLGGASSPAADNKVAELSSLWSSAPDVSGSFS